MYMDHLPVQAWKNVDSLKDWKTSQVPLLSSLSSELTVQRENLIYHLGDEWKRLVIWRVPSTKGETFLVGGGLVEKN